LQACGGDSRQMHQGGVKKLEKEAGVGGAEKEGGHKQAHHHGHGYGRGHGHGGHHGPKAHTTPEDRPQQSNDPSQGPSRRHRHSPYPMLSVADALWQIDTHTPSPTIVTLPVNEALVGHVLAEDVTAPESVPAFRASIVDGYAVIAGADAPSTKGTFPVAMISHAQAGEHQELQKGQIARITTGAPLPPGATSVVMVEDTLLVSKTDDGTEEKEVEILAADIKVGENVREVGSDVQAGEIIMRKGEGISAVGGEFGLLASVGVKQVSVYKKPVVGVLSTGDEIVNHDREGELRRGEVRDTNRPTLLTAIRGSGFEAVDLGIVSDKCVSLTPVHLYQRSTTQLTRTPPKQTRRPRTNSPRRNPQSRRDNHLGRRQHGRTRPPETDSRALSRRPHPLRPRGHETRQTHHFRHHTHKVQLRWLSHLHRCVFTARQSC